MTDQQTADTQQLDAHQQLIEKGKSLGIKQAVNMKPENLEKRIAEIEAKDAKEPEKVDETLEVEVSINEFGLKFLNSIGFDMNWFKPLAQQYNVEKFEYLHKFRAFRAYKDGRHVDWIDVNDFGILNGKRELCEILLKHASVAKDRRLFNFHWRV